MLRGNSTAFLPSLLGRGNAGASRGNVENGSRADHRRGSGWPPVKWVTRNIHVNRAATGGSSSDAFSVRTSGDPLRGHSGHGGVQTREQAVGFDAPGARSAPQRKGAVLVRSARRRHGSDPALARLDVHGADFPARCASPECRRSLGDEPRIHRRRKGRLPNPGARIFHLRLALRAPDAEHAPGGRIAGLKPAVRQSRQRPGGIEVGLRRAGRRVGDGHRVFDVRQDPRTQNFR